MTYRPGEIISWIDREYAKRAERGSVRSRHACRPERQGLCAVIEDMRSLFNVGAIFRSADGAGFGKIHLCGITATPPRKEIAKTSLGAEDHVAWEYHPTAAAALVGLKRDGHFLVGLEIKPDSRLLSDVILDHDLNYPLALVVGNEVDGLSAEAQALSDTVCHLPMRGHKESLNAAVAFGIAAYALAEGVERGFIAVGAAENTGGERLTSGSAGTPRPSGDMPSPAISD